MSPRLSLALTAGPPLASRSRGVHRTALSILASTPRARSPDPLPRAPCPCSLGSPNFCLKDFREQHFSLRHSHKLVCLRSAVRRITVPYRQGFERLCRKGNEG